MSNKRDDRHLELAKVSIVEVATIAAHLPPETPACDAVKRAYELLEWAAAAREGFDDDFQPTAEWGIYREQLYLEKEKASDELQAKALPRKRVDGVFQPHPFDAVLANLMGKVKKVDRLPRFKWWMMEKTNQTTNEQAAHWVAKWRKSGVPDEIYRLAHRTFDAWWRDRERKRLSKQGKAPKKGKQGRVKSKTDKRTEARPPVEEFKKALGL